MKTIKTFAQMSAIALAGTITFAACSSDDDKVQNINPTYDGKSVKTQFAINIPRAAQTRQTAEITQDNGNFRGMQDIKLVPMTVVGSENTNIENLIELSAIDANSGLENSIKIYNDVDIAIGTKNFLFYGKAPKDENASNANAAYGKLTSNFNTTDQDKTAANISFSLNPIHSGTLTDASLLGILNGIVGIEDWQNSNDVSLQTALTDIEKLTVGSSNAILKAVEKLYNVVVNASNEPVATIIKTEIEKYFTPTQGTSYTLAYKENYTPTNSSTALTINTDFPTDLGLPEGAARLTCTNNHNFSYVDATTIGDASIATSTITYPAELYYFANTPLKASNNENDSFGWGNDTWTDWGDEVQATTRLIALTNKINYGVALLTTNVKLNAITLKDNKGEDVTVTGNNSNLEFTGILIGGQPAKVGWDFNPITGETFTQTIYDNTMNSTTALSTTDNITNYTMVLDNNGSKGTADNTGNTPNNSVNIAIELENNTGSEFQGVDGVVANGAKFYLVAKLDPTDDDDTNVDRVFLQDYTTTANLTITSLKNAYVTIPDLRATQLKLGLYVDLDWQSGLTFDVEIGGDIN